MDLDKPSIRTTPIMKDSGRMDNFMGKVNLFGLMDHFIKDNTHKEKSTVLVSLPLSAKNAIKVNG